MRKLAIGATLAMVLAALPAGASLAPKGPLPGTSCAVFPADNIWNTDISGLPVHPKNDVWMRSMHARGTLLHPDFGRQPYGLPFEAVDNSTPAVDVAFQYASESDQVKYPLSAGTPIESGSDHHALMINRDTCKLYELYATRWNSGSPTAGSGAVFDLGSNALRPAGWTSADAAGLPIFPGLVRYDEVQAGIIGHAIRFTVDCTRNRYLWPARHQAATGGKDCPPMGARFRLRAGYDISSFSTDAQAVLQAMKTYGLILADNGSDWYFQGTSDSRWSDTLLDQLKMVPARRFVAVDESSCMISPDSGQSSC